MLATESARPSTSPAPRLQPQLSAMTVPMAVATAIWATAPGTAIHRHGQQRLDREVQPDPEHQQDHADFRELAGDAPNRRRTPA